MNKLLSQTSSSTSFPTSFFKTRSSDENYLCGIDSKILTIVSL